VTPYLKAQQCDLFFAYAAILVEGPAERMLVPHFIRFKYPQLNQCYITMLEIGGSHAHRLRPLIDELKLLTVVITNLDAGNAATRKDGASERGARGMGEAHKADESSLPRAGASIAQYDAKRGRRAGTERAH
jgi:predicted ATP-dependent endonuclease of OLD family